MTADAVLDLLPRGGRGGCCVTRSDSSNNWRVFYGPANIRGTRWSRAKSWGESGDEKRCICFVIKKVWELHCKIHNNTPLPQFLNFEE